MKKRCVVMVAAGQYRQPGQCTKVHGLRLVKLQDRQVPVCAHHRAVLDRRGAVVRAGR